MNDTSDFQELVEIAEASIREHCKSDVAGKSLHLRNGECIIVDANNDKLVHGLLYKVDWTNICRILMNSPSFQKHLHQHLDITFDYFGLLTKEGSDGSFARAKRAEMFHLMKPAIDHRQYISCTDLMAITSTETICHLISEDPIPDLTSAEQRQFLDLVLKRGRRNLVMCIYAQLQMQCVREVLKKHDDETLSTAPIVVEDYCHVRCKPDFGNLVQNQGAFNAAQFGRSDEHMSLHRHVVVPIDYRREERHPEDHSDDKFRTSSELQVLKVVDQNPSNVHTARCGAGAYGSVYRVRLDPAYNNFTWVSYKASAFRGTWLNIVQDRHADFAMKEFKDQSSRTKAVFMQELAILNELRRYSTDRIVTHLASWAQGGTYRMLFPYAQCDLRRFMRRSTFVFGRKNTLWLLDQFLGLANALRQIHNLSEPRRCSRIIRKPSYYSTRSQIGLASRPQAGKHTLLQKSGCTQR